MQSLSIVQTSDEYYMQVALQMAENANSHHEVPVGAVLVYEDEIISKGWNCPISTQDPTAHAEIVTLRHAAVSLQNYRLIASTLYVTLEPCLMCVGALIHARINRLVFGAYDPRAGAIASQLKILDETFFNHRVQYVGGVLEAPCAHILRQFFQKRR